MINYPTKCLYRFASWVWLLLWSGSQAKSVWYPYRHLQQQQTQPMQRLILLSDVEMLSTHSKLLHKQDHQPLDMSDIRIKLGKVAGAVQRRRDTVNNIEWQYWIILHAHWNRIGDDKRTGKCAGSQTWPEDGIFIFYSFLHHQARSSFHMLSWLFEYDEPK